jgi:hypothetical protein
MFSPLNPRENNTIVISNLHTSQFIRDLPHLGLHIYARKHARSHKYALYDSRAGTIQATLSLACMLRHTDCTTRVSVVSVPLIIQLQIYGVQNREEHIWKIHTTKVNLLKNEQDTPTLETKPEKEVTVVRLQIRFRGFPEFEDDSTGTSLLLKLKTAKSCKKSPPRWKICYSDKAAEVCLSQHFPARFRAIQHTCFDRRQCLIRKCSSTPGVHNPWPPNVFLEASLHFPRPTVLTSMIKNTSLASESASC